MFLITAHESTAYLIITACRMLKDWPNAGTGEIVRMAVERDFPIQSIIRQTYKDIRWNNILLPEGRRLRIHIAAAFGGGGHANRSFGLGANTCPGARLALTMAEAFVDAIRPMLQSTRFLEMSGDRQTTPAARRFCTLAAITGSA